MDQTLLQLDRVGKRYGDKRILTAIDLHVLTGQTWCIFGPNGAGKTTLLRLLAGLITPDEGKLTRGPQLDRSGTVGMVGHQPQVYRDLSAHENLVYFARLHHVRQPAERATEMLHALGLDHAGETPVGRFSRGMQQRLAIARALLPGPSLVLLDEPFSGLDQGGIDDVCACLNWLQQQHITLLLSTHQLEIADRLGQFALCLDHGRVVFSGPRADEPFLTLYRRLYTS